MVNSIYIIDSQGHIQYNYPGGKGFFSILPTQFQIILEEKERCIMKKVMFFFGIFISLLVINTAFAQSKLDCFLQINKDSNTKILGESQDSKYRNWIEILSFNSGPIQGQSGVELTLAKRLDKTSIQLKDAFISSQRFQTAVLSCVARTPTRQEQLRIDIEEITVIKYTLSVQNGIP